MFLNLIISYCLKYVYSIPLKSYFNGFCWGISNIFHGVYLTYTPSHRMLIHLKDLTVTYGSSHKVLMYIKSNLVNHLQVVDNIKRVIALWDRRQLNLTCIHRISLILTLAFKDILLMVGLTNTYSCPLCRNYDCNSCT